MRLGPARNPLKACLQHIDRLLKLRSGALYPRARSMVVVAEIRPEPGGALRGGSVVPPTSAGGRKAP